MSQDHCCSQGLDIVQAKDKKFIEDLCWGEHLTQVEDVELCNLVQEGVSSPAYDVGRCEAAAQQLL